MKYLVTKQSVMMVFGMIALAAILIGCTPQSSEREDTSHTEQRIDEVLQSDRSAERTYEIIHDRYAEELEVQRKILHAAYLDGIDVANEEEAQDVFKSHLEQLETVYEEGLAYMEVTFETKPDATEELHNEWVTAFGDVFAAESFMLLFGDEELIIPEQDLVIH